MSLNKGLLEFQLLWHLKLLFSNREPAVIPPPFSTLNILSQQTSSHFAMTKHFFFLTVPCGFRNLSSLTPDPIRALAVKVQHANHWSTREVPHAHLLVLTLSSQLFPDLEWIPSPVRRSCLPTKVKFKCQLLEVPHHK